ncbi:MAG: hypothetical protein KY455_04590 [Euryarchaeota archaeon]|nr:hypothetical protein [Euryarchaeota archaeon]
MLLVTLLVSLAATVVVEAACTIGLPNLWTRPRFVVQPLLGGIVAFFVPTDLMAMAPWFDHWLSALLGAVVGLLVAAAGLFNQRFFIGPSESDVRRSGMRSFYARR